MAKYTRKYDLGLNSVIPDIIEYKGWKEKLDSYSFFPLWHKIVDESVSQCSKPVKVVKEVLWLEVDNSTWMQQLQYEKFQILDAVNAQLKLTRIRDIKFMLSKDDGEARKRKPVARVNFVSVDPARVRAFEEQVSSITDDEIRESLVRLWYLAHACVRGEDEK